MAAKYVEPRMTPLVHQRNHIRADFAFTQKHFQYYVPKNFLQHAGINGRGNGKISNPKIFAIALPYLQ